VNEETLKQMQQDFDVLGYLDQIKANGSGTQTFADLFAAANSTDEALEILRNARAVCQAAGYDWRAEDLTAMALDFGFSL
jgi:hypothetical protein